MATITAIQILAGIAAAGAVVGAVQQHKIGKAQKKQNKITNKVAAIGRRRNIKRTIAANRIKAAQVQSAGFSLGVSGSTAVQGAVSGIQSDTASSIGFSNLQTTGSGFVADLQNSISGFQGVQATAGAVTNIAGGLAANEQAVAGLQDFFGG